jgi:hypothetical protein
MTINQKLRAEAIENDWHTYETRERVTLHTKCNAPLGKVREPTNDKDGKGRWIVKVKKRCILCEETVWEGLEYE